MLLLLWDRLFSGDFEGKGKDVYRAHYSLVRQLVPPEQLLEYDVSQGWEPLCKFLGEEVPNAREMPFPYYGSTSDFLKGMRKKNRRRMREMTVKATAFVLAIACVWILFGYLSRWTGMI